jgi:hypothetical protein
MNNKPTEYCYCECSTLKGRTVPVHVRRLGTRKTLCGRVISRDIIQKGRASYCKECVRRSPDEFLEDSGVLTVRP